MCSSLVGYAWRLNVVVLPLVLYDPCFLELRFDISQSIHVDNWDNIVLILHEQVHVVMVVVYNAAMNKLEDGEEDHR
jgi:hypothetical protein